MKEIDELEKACFDVFGFIVCIYSRLKKDAICPILSPYACASA